ncbi:MULTISPECIES: DUF6663 family protein [Halobacterium]|uniref:Uncharacterized protein n=3 Tax=Halobacterium salinarum TaxID=2242 RepID=Q9HRF1_HALSA|nr:MULTISPECIES: DUF6663 family protein [Halobacterium]AAG19207.1 hypothetical protein VNG_0729H [Halobacterium salinarum NRC-1]MBB6090050.1 hypothetical protein [Halobacterium salinarum]MCF2165774.1 hypothetical protein [Halobacterium salinarum]MCF2168262.1 hypothetical protein [Halobacterium salinarum]MCF2238437.1 hypothetical protein [Halobacterium salinarum]
MQTTTASQYRVLGDAPDRDGLLVLDRADYEPLRVTTGDAEGALDDTVAALRPGYLVDATLAWNDGDARFTDVDIQRRTLLTFARGVSGLFEAALDTMADAHENGVGVTGRPTFNTDNEPNGAVYAFAQQPGERDIFTEIRTGRLPIEPLVDRLDEDAADAHEVFVFDPLDHEFTIVYLVAHRDSVLADTVRDTYDCPRPPETDRD